MANQLIQPYVAGTQAAATLPLHDPRYERAHRSRFLRIDIPKLERANSFYVANGRWPSRGWVLLRREDYNNLNLYATNLQLNFADVQTGTQVTLQNLSIVQAQCVSRGIAADPDAIYLVELTDRQGIAWNKWFEFPTESDYNVRSPAYPQQFYSGSLLAGSPFTWSQMLSDLWGQMASILFAYPGLPITPSGTPENFSFPGTTAWGAVNLILDLLGCTVASNLQSATAPYSIVQGGTADANFTALQAKYAPVLQDDLEWIDTGSGRVPGTVLVLFHRRNDQYGTEETIRNDALQWFTTPFYSVPVTSPAPFNNAPGMHYIWCEFTVRFDINNNPLPADVATANAIAAERVNQYFARIYRQTLGYMRQVYTGVLPFVTGSQVDGVCWRQDYKDGRQGWVTEIVRGPDPAWEEVRVGTREEMY